MKRSLTLLILVSALSCPHNTAKERTASEMDSVSGLSRKLQDQSETRLDSLDSIRFYFSPSSTFSLGDPSLESELFNSLLPSVQEFFAARLRVNRIEGNLALESLSSICSEGISVPGSHQNPGVSDTDLIIYLISESINDLNVITRSSACVQESGERTNVLAGFIAINTQAYSALNSGLRLANLIHEMFHILAFDVNSFNTFMKPDGSLYSFSELTEVVTVRGVQKTVYKGPGVLQRARDYFDCPSLPGLELEEYGAGEYNVASHWDARVMMNDVMTGSILEDPIYSIFTFGLLEDSSWYSIDWTYPETPVFGKGKGCEFINETCMENLEPAFIPEFCAMPEIISTSCNFYHTAEAKCNRNILDFDIPTEFQYFTYSKDGGSYVYTDYCPITEPVDNRNCLDPSTFTIVETYGEKACANCKCLVGTLSANTDKKGTFHAACFELIGGCESNVPRFRIGNEAFGYFEADCPQGGVIRPPSSSSFDGYLECPDPNIICGNFPCLNSCQGRGKCNQGYCECQSGRGGDDCSIICDPTCFNCTGTFSNQCSNACTGNNRVLVDGSCVCPSGYVESGNDCVNNTNCQGLCQTCSFSDTTQCADCVDNAQRLDTSVDYSSCVCDSGFTSSGTICVQDSSSNCQGLCRTCDPFNPTLCLECVDNAERSNTKIAYSSCVCESGFTSNGTSCVQDSSSNCQGLCRTCDPSNPTLCLDCVNNAERSNTNTAYSSCICESGFTSNGTSCVQDSSSNCQGLCNTCDPSNPTLCLECVDNAERSNASIAYSSCICEAGFTSTGTSCVRDSSSTCQGLCRTCNSSYPTLCLECVDNAERSNAKIKYSSCVCQAGYTSNGSSCAQDSSSACQGLCKTCDPSNPTLCLECVDNAERSNMNLAYSSCICETGFTSTGSSCIRDFSTNCQGLCNTCDPSNPTLCLECVDNAERSNTNIAYSSCVCEAGYTSNGVSCVQDSSSICQGLCRTCDPSNPTLCLECIDNAERSTTSTVYSSCVCEAGFTSNGTSCVQESSSNCQGLCRTCDPSNPTLCLDCVNNAERSNTNTAYSSCICETGFTSTGTSCVQDSSSTCQGLCKTCNSSHPTLCLECVDNAERLNTNTLYSSCICNSGFTSAGTSCVRDSSSTCEGLCSTCDPSNPTFCLECVDNAERSNINLAYSSCICEGGFTSTGTSCIQDFTSNCEGLCRTCDPFNPTSCLECIENAYRLDPDEDFSSCICDAGYTSTGNSCVSPGTFDEFVFEFTSPLIQQSQFETFLPISTHHPDPSPFNGLYFDGNDFLGVRPTNEQTLDYRTFGFRAWARLLDEGGILLKITESVSLRSLLQLPKLEFFLSSSSDLQLVAEFTTVQQFTISEVTASTWLLLGFSIEYDEISQTSRISLYSSSSTIFTTEVPEVFSLMNPSIISVGGSAVGNDIHGFILSIALATGSIPDDFFDTGSFCVNPPDCNLPGGSCEFGQLLISGRCEECNCGGDPCIRQTDCKLNTDFLCETFTSFYKCEECIEDAIENNGECICRENSTLDPQTNKCICSQGYYQDNGECKFCHNFFDQNMVSAQLKETYHQIDIYFTKDVIERWSDCSKLFMSNSSIDLGNNHICTWPTSRHLQVELGTAFDISISELSLKPYSFRHSSCGVPIADLDILVDKPEGSTPSPKAHINGPNTISLACWDEDLIITGEGSTGLTQHALVYEWTVKSSPANYVLFSHIQQLDYSTIAIPLSYLTTGTHEIQLRVTNVFGNHDTTTHILEVVHHPAMTLVIEPSYRIETALQEDLIIKASVINDCNVKEVVTYQWNYGGTTDGEDVLMKLPGIINSNEEQYNALIFEPGTLPIGHTYMFTATASNTSVQGTITLYLTVVKPRLVSVISKLSGPVSSWEDLTLDGSASYDPYESSILSFNWSCFGDCPSVSDISRPEIIIPQDTLEIGSTFVSTLTVSEGSRQDSSEVELTVVDLPPDQIPKPTPLFTWNTSDNLLLTVESYDIAGDVVWHQVLGDKITPITPNGLPFIKFASDQFSEGQYYGWEAIYTSTEGKELKELFTWRISGGVECLSDLMIDHKYSDTYALILENCESRDSNEKAFLYVFGYVYKGEEIPLSGLTSNNYFQVKVPRGTHDLFGKMCDSDMECSTKYAVLDHTRRLSEDEIEFLFIEDTTNPDKIPSSVLYYSIEYSLNEKEWNLMFDALRSYMSNQPVYGKELVSACIAALSALLDQEIVNHSKMTIALEMIEKIVLENKLILSSLDLRNMYRALDRILPKERENVAFIQTVERVIDNCLSYHMLKNPPFDDPVMVFSERIYSYRERVLGNSMPGQTFDFYFSSIEFPLSLPSSSSQLVDISVTIIELESPIIFTKLLLAGEYENYSFSIRKDEIVLDSVSVIMKIASPNLKNGSKCFQIVENRWKDNLCSIEGNQNISYSVSMDTNSVISLVNTSSSPYDLKPVYFTAFLLALMGILALVRRHFETKIPEIVSTNTFSIDSNSKIGMTIMKNMHKKATEEVMPEIKEIESVNHGKSQGKPKGCYQNHLLFRLFSKDLPSATLKILTLFVDLFCCYSFSGIASTLFFEPELLFDYVLDVIFVSICCSIVTIAIEFCLNKVNKLIAYVLAIGYIALTAAVNLFIVMNKKSSGKWFIVFGFALCVEIFFLQTLFAISLKILSKK